MIEFRVYSFKVTLIQCLNYNFAIQWFIDVIENIQTMIFIASLLMGKETLEL